ncbi:hypothetical protein SYNPS1DRAFT_27863 [Syncephalis pseudoplumigaleata]|uniref:Uncharacterized protein n=1 Tax=Syncephalis pseudoplumigaleata TaxID=1712513 RepID=A0A4P9YTD9_9FUNG|nr:hypothetical protein SYNPS1DRAFT_31330 [Syncephalis pseudoplumigaleata]RKP26445.1 hypothetical protein SYNPS1DRAFT_27863 [Syncephalis pseudoplumigaleata]|eukprot:RKP22978.1 hypothetical protein SYNPS1DRAFT_31330 [Syncephalis pseudoplumigaleata]
MEPVKEKYSTKKETAAKAPLRTTLLLCAGHVVVVVVVVVVVAVVAVEANAVARHRDNGDWQTLPALDRANESGHSLCRGQAARASALADAAGRPARMPAPFGSDGSDGKAGTACRAMLAAPFAATGY